MQIGWILHKLKPECGYVLQGEVRLSDTHNEVFKIDFNQQAPKLGLWILDNDNENHMAWKHEDTNQRMTWTRVSPDIAIQLMAKKCQAKEDTKEIDITSEQCRRVKIIYILRMYHFSIVTVRARGCVLLTEIYRC